MTIYQRAEDALRLWQTLVPCSPPPMKQFIVWLSQFSDASVERAIMRVSDKYRTGKFNTDTPDEVAHRYATGVMVNLRREQSAA